MRNEQLLEARARVKAALAGSSPQDVIPPRNEPRSGILITALPPLLQLQWGELEVGSRL